MRGCPFVGWSVGRSDAALPGAPRRLSHRRLGEMVTRQVSMSPSGRRAMCHLLSVLVAGFSGLNALREVIKHTADCTPASLTFCVAEVLEFALAVSAFPLFLFDARLDLLLAQRREFFFTQRFALSIQVGETLQIGIALSEHE